MWQNSEYAARRQGGRGCARALTSDFHNGMPAFALLAQPDRHATPRAATPCRKKSAKVRAKTHTHVKSSHPVSNDTPCAKRYLGQTSQPASQGARRYHTSTTPIAKRVFTIVRFAAPNSRARAYIETRGTGGYIQENACGTECGYRCDAARRGMVGGGRAMRWDV